MRLLGFALPVGLFGAMLLIPQQHLKVGSVQAGDLTPVQELRMAQQGGASAENFRAVDAGVPTVKVSPAGMPNLEGVPYIPPKVQTTK